MPLPDSHLYSFLAYYLAAKSGIRKGGELVLECTESDLSQFYPGFSQDALTNIEREWIKTGIWDTNLFLEEIGVGGADYEHTERCDQSRLHQ